MSSICSGERILLFEAKSKGHASRQQAARERSKYSSIESSSGRMDSVPPSVDLYASDADPSSLKRSTTWVTALHPSKVRHLPCHGSGTFSSGSPSYNNARGASSMPPNIGWIPASECVRQRKETLRVAK